MTSARRLSSGVTLSGIAASHRNSIRTGVAIASIATVTLAFSGCAPTEEGIVMEGADGNKYVVPEGAERPEYTSKEDCIADVTEQIDRLRASGETVDDTPEDLCEPAQRYGHSSALWLGPLLFAGSRWGSSRVSSWAPVSNRNFAASGSTLQSDVVTRAPAGATTGQRTPLANGFGSSGKAGFGSSAKSGFGSSVGG